MKELEATAQNLRRITDENSELNQALADSKPSANTSTVLPRRTALFRIRSPISKNHATALTENDNLKVTLQNFRRLIRKIEIDHARTWNQVWPQTLTEFYRNHKNTTMAVDLAEHQEVSENLVACARRGQRTITVRKITKAKDIRAQRRPSAAVAQVNIVRAVDFRLAFLSRECRPGLPGTVWRYGP